MTNSVELLLIDAAFKSHDSTYSEVIELYEESCYNIRTVAILKSIQSTVFSDKHLKQAQHREKKGITLEPLLTIVDE